MANTNFYLKYPKAKEETLIYLFHSRHGQRYKFSTGYKIHPKFWNNEDQRVRKSFEGYSGFNDYLESLGEDINNIFRDAKTKKATTTHEYVREQFKKLSNKDEVKREENFFDYFDEFIKLAKTRIKPNTIKKYTTLLNHLKTFQRVKSYKLSFEKMDAKFYENFIAYCISDLKHLNASMDKNISNLKAFLHWATERGYNTNTSFLKFTGKKEDAQIIYLTEEELMGLYKLDLNGNKILEDVRDIFCFGCFTGLRFSDISQLQKENIRKDEIHFTTQKTKDNLIVPLNDYAKEIIERHNFKLPVKSNQKTNSHIKKIGEIAKINETVLLTKYRGSEEVKFKEPKYEFMSTHTARRTFVTLSLEKGMRAETVMSITGHKDYKTFKKYIKLTSKVKLVEMKRIWHKEPLLKAV